MGFRGASQPIDRPSEVLMITQHQHGSHRSAAAEDQRPNPAAWEAAVLDAFELDETTGDAEPIYGDFWPEGREDGTAW